MPYKAIVSDWNGTLFEYPTDEVQNRRIAYAVLNSAKAGLKRGNLTSRFSALGDIIGLARTKHTLKKRLKEYQGGGRDLASVYQPFNDGVINGLSAEFVEGVLDQYAQESKTMVDSRMMDPLRVAHVAGKQTGILSVSLDYSIQRILRESGYGDVFDRITANRINVIEHSPGMREATGFTLDIYGRKKDVFVDRIVRPSGETEDNFLYIGDSEDDEPIADVLPKDHFVVPFLATDEFRERMARKGAFVPVDESDLSNFLEKY